MEELIAGAVFRRAVHAEAIVKGDNVCWIDGELG